MPHGVHNIPAKTYRPDPQVHEQAKAAVRRVDSNLNEYLNGFLRWLVHETDELPERPPKE